MTREEKQKAIDALKISAPVMAVTQEEFENYIQTLNKIMDWLEHEPTGSNNLSSGTRKNSKKLESISTTKENLGVDAVSRADVLKLMKDNWHTHNGDWAMQESMDDIRALPSVTPKEICKDCISRQVLIDWVKNWTLGDATPLIDFVNSIPSVTPQPRKGHWINKQRFIDSCSCSAECSLCHKRSNGYTHNNGYGLECTFYDFCPKCGSDNREVENEIQSIS